MKCFLIFFIIIYLANISEGSKRKSFWANPGPPPPEDSISDDDIGVKVNHDKIYDDLLDISVGDIELPTNEIVFKAKDLENPEGIEIILDEVTSDAEVQDTGPLIQIPLEDADVYVLPYDELDSIPHSGNKDSKNPSNKNLYDVTEEENENDTLARWEKEKNAGNPLEFSGTNPHIYQPSIYMNLSRKFVLQYPYNEILSEKAVASPQDKEIIPIKAPLEVVQKVAKQSALEEAAKAKNEVQDVDYNKILRSGDYWNDFWVEEGTPKSAARMPSKKVLSTIKTKIKPGSELYDIVAKLKKISPRLLYIINKQDK